MPLSRRGQIERFFSNVDPTILSSRRRGIGYQPIEPIGSYVLSQPPDVRELLSTLTGSDMANLRPDESLACAHDWDYWNRRYEESKH